jgi:hypothetical protein
MLTKVITLEMSFLPVHQNKENSQKLLHVSEISSHFVTTFPYFPAFSYSREATLEYFATQTSPLLLQLVLRTHPILPYD